MDIIYLCTITRDYNVYIMKGDKYFTLNLHGYISLDKRNKLYNQTFYIKETIDAFNMTRTLKLYSNNNKPLQLYKQQIYERARINISSSELNDIIITEQNYTGIFDYNNSFTFTDKNYKYIINNETLEINQLNKLFRDYKYDIKPEHWFSIKKIDYLIFFIKSLITSIMDNILKTFFKTLNDNNIYGYIDGGKCFEYYYKQNIDTFDYDISLFINEQQLINKNTFNIIYNIIIQLYNDLKELYELIPLQKIDYSNLYKYDIPQQLRNKQIQYIDYNIIGDIQIETINYKTLIDLNISLTTNINYIKSIINNDYYININTLIRKFKCYYNDLPKFSSKKYIIKSRLSYLQYLKT
jgi:hypothetical protein